MSKSKMRRSTTTGRKKARPVKSRETKRKNSKQVGSDELVEETKSSIKALKEAYEDFLEDDSRVNSPGIQAYTFRPDEIVFQVFHFKEDYESNVSEGLKKDDKPPKTLRYFGVAKVLGGGEYALKENPAGSIIHLKDMDVATITNPQYSLWIKNNMSNSNATKVGSEPPETMSKIATMQQNNMFIVDKIKLFTTSEDYLTFCTHTNSIKGPVKNPENLFSDNGIA